MKRKLTGKFLLSLAVLGIILTVVFSVCSYYNTKGSLEKRYASQVVNGSRTVANLINLDDLRAVMGENGDQTDGYTRLLAFINQIKKDEEITYLSITRPDEDSVTFYIDGFVEEMGDDPANALPYGSDILYTDAAASETELQVYYDIWYQFRDNKGLDKPVLTDNRYGYNYTAIAAIYDEDGNAIAEVQYIIDMHNVKSTLRNFLISIIILSLIIIDISLLGYALFIRNDIIAPIGRLAGFTKEITDSQDFIGKSIDLNRTDEIGELGSSFNSLLAELKNYIDNLSRVTAEKERIGAELDVAKNIQASMLPCIFPAYPDRDEFSIYATMTPAKEVGGDFYDFFMVDDRHLAIVMADVSGKGVPAALFMVIGKTLIKDHTLYNGEALNEVFENVNNLLCESNSEGLFITAFEGVLDLETGELTFVNAGHEMPFIYRRGEGYSAYKIKPGFVLAGMEGIIYRCGSVTLNEGDKLFQYTDGVTEATNSSNELFGMERLTQSLNKCCDMTPEDTLHSIKADIDAFVCDAPQFDDITMLCIDYRKKYSK